LAPNLKGRLARIRKIGLVKATEIGEVEGSGGARLPAEGRRVGVSSPQARRRASFLAGWDQEADLVWARRLGYELPLPLSLDIEAFEPLKRRRREPRPSSLSDGEAIRRDRMSLEELRFFDLETTGLSGGTGTIAFLAAVGRIKDGEFELSQVFLEDFPGEKSFLDLLLSWLSGSSGLVSYNGRAFDLPLLRTRCVMNGIQQPRPGVHVDALFAARRLWRRVYGGASLGLIEREVLGLERAEDLPGSMIPEVWLSCARQGDHPLMSLALAHNAQDVVSLARILARAQAIFDEPLSHSGRADLDRLGLGRTLLALGRAEEGEKLLEAAAGEGDEAAGLILSARYRRSGRIEACLGLAALLPSTYACAVEKAKLFERSLHDLASASRFAAEALRLAPSEAAREAAKARAARIAKRICVMKKTRGPRPDA
jgi:uncharacterized protein YprB with RNaseH-like and TPR domain